MFGRNRPRVSSLYAFGACKLLRNTKKVLTRCCDILKSAGFFFQFLLYKYSRHTRLLFFFCLICHSINTSTFSPSREKIPSVHSTHFKNGGGEFEGSVFTLEMARNDAVLVLGSGMVYYGSVNIFFSSRTHLSQVLMGTRSSGEHQAKPSLIQSCLLGTTSRREI